MMYYDRVQCWHGKQWTSDVLWMAEQAHLRLYLLAILSISLVPCVSRGKK